MRFPKLGEIRSFFSGGPSDTTTEGKKRASGEPPIDAMRSMGAMIAKAFNPGMGRGQAKQAGNDFAANMMKGMIAVLEEQQRETFLHEMLVKADEKKELTDTERGKLQEIVERAVDAYDAALQKDDASAGWKALRELKAAKKAQGASLEGISEMTNNLFSRSMIKAAREVLDPKANHELDGTHGPMETISSLLRQRKRLEITFTPEALKLAADAWSAFSARDEARTEALDNGTIPPSVQEAQAGEWKYLWHLSPDDAAASLRAFGFTPDNLPEGARKAFDTAIDIDLGFRLSRLRTVLYDGNPLNAADGFRRIGDIERIGAIAAEWRLPLEGFEVKDLAKLHEFKAAFEAWRAETSQARPEASSS